MNYKAIIFDCDGTLVDSMETHYLAWIAALKLYNLEFPKSRFYKLGGVPTDKIIGILANEAQVTVDVKEVAAHKDRFFWNYLETLRPIDRVCDIVRSHKGKVPLAVATGSSRSVAIKELELIGMVDFFDTIVCAEDVKNHKPAPDVFLVAASRLDVSPEKCLVYEDTDIGLNAAKSAGMSVVDVREL